MFIRKRLINLSLNFDVMFFENTNFLFLKGLLGFVVLRLPSFFFFKNNVNLSFVFLNRFYFLSVFKHFSYLYRRLFFFNYVKIKIKGLGYRIRKVFKYLFKFFFGHTNFFYFHVPSDIIVKSKKKRMILLSNNMVSLKKVLAHLLLLKKLSVYRIRGLLYPRFIVVLKIGKKNM